MSSGFMGAPRVQSALRLVLFSAIFVAVMVCIVYSYETYRVVARDPGREKQVLLSYGLEGHSKRLDPQFIDADGDLLADPVTDPAKLIDPATLTAAYIKTTTGSESVDWDKLAKGIATETGKEVFIDSFDAIGKKLDAIKASQINVLIVHAVETPYLVNHFGFIPFAIAADSHGPSGHRMEIIVPAKGTMQNIADLKSRSLLCTEPLSIVGYRAAIAYLHETWDLKPDFDFTVTFSGGQKESILGITQGKYEMATVSSDKLRSMTKKGDITPEQYRVIYSSEVIPRYAVGYFHNLKPELAASVKRAVLSFVNPPDPNDEDHPERFIAAVYAKDFGTVRSIDDAFDPRLTAPTTNPSDAEAGSAE